MSDDDSGAGSGSRTLPYARPGAAPKTGVNTLVSSGEAGAARAPSSSFDSFEQRYELGELLGSGGMGDVRSGFDRRIGREVAVKWMRSEHAERADLRARFDREARIQGRLEHPSVVPVYDLGERSDGGVYFTMKCVRGFTLEQVISSLRAGDPELEASYSRRRLLSAFSNVCLAIAFAHSRGVVHRDLKPSNVILGDFGEVNVLDWGVAKLVAPDEAEAAPIGRRTLPPRAAGALADLTPPESTRAPEITARGAILGTPGYMAPEQARGLADAIDGRTDVYAMGCMLFELLSLQPLHPREPMHDAIASTLRGPDARPSTRAPERGIPPELDAICVRASALEPGERFATAREMHEAIERYLDGDRDIALRRQLAEGHVAAARAALSRGEREPRGGLAGRADALRELNAALALDPTHTPALSTLARLLTDTPERLPPQAEGELRFMRIRQRWRSARASAAGFASVILLLPLAPLVGVASWLALIPMLVLAFLLCLLSLRMASLRPPGRLHVLSMVVGTAAFAASLGVLFGPFVLPPIVALAAGLYIIVDSRAQRRTRSMVLGASSLAVALPILAEAFGVWPSAVHFTGDAFSVEALAIHFSPVASRLALLFATLMAVAFPLFIISRSVSTLARAERRLFAQAWQLQQLLPDAARGTSVAPPPDSIDPG
jgi:eukaryotic-like serine/threonine-protein kinase